MKKQKTTKLKLNKFQISNLSLLNLKGGNTTNCLTNTCDNTCNADGTGDGTDWTSIDDDTTDGINTDDC